MFRIGFGYDVHQLGAGRDLWLGGVNIPHHKGCIAHSDGDVLLHAVCDALLGAVALGDIGTHFPDTSEKFKDIDSKILLHETVKLLNKAGYSLGNLDATLCLQRPKLKPYIEAMRQTMADLLKVDIQAVSVKATTTEKLGFVGNESGVSAYAVVLVQPFAKSG